MGSRPENTLSFFKVFNKATCSDKLKFPSPFALHILGTLPRMVSLRDQYGNRWPVKLENIENGLYFGDGWAKFAEDNSIETEDFIFFQCCDGKVFDVKLTGRNGCDKIGVGACKLKIKEEEHMEAETVGLEMEEQEKQLGRKQVKGELAKGLARKVGKKQVKGELAKGLARKVGKKQVKVKLAKGLAWKVGKPKSKDTDKGLRESSRDKNSGAKRGRTKAPDYYGANIFNSGVLPVPKNPYFLTKIRPKRREELYIPIDVLRDCCIEKLPDKATLRDSKGRTWSVSLTKWSDGRKFYTGGWRSFCRLNFVGVDDLIVCEFVKGTGEEDLILQLQVVPTGNNAIANAKTDG